MQCIERQQNPCPEGRAGREPVGLVLKDSGHGEGSAANGQAVAEPYAQPVENAALNRKAVLSHERGKPAAFVEGHGPVERIGAIHRLEVHQRLAAAVRFAGHGAQGGNLADFSERLKISPLGGPGLAVDERGFRVAAEQFLAFPLRWNPEWRPRGC